MQTEAMVRTTFSGNGVCGECHTASFVGGRPKIAPVAFPVRYMHKGWFDHRPHETVELRNGNVVSGQQACVACHDATKSATSSDLLLPPLQTSAGSTVMGCRDCHGGETTSKAVPSGCAMCHDFHMDQGAPSQLIRQRVRGKKQDNNVIARGPSVPRKIALAQVPVAEGKR
jgi:cytochrome c553